MYPRKARPASHISNNNNVNNKQTKQKHGHVAFNPPKRINAVNFIPHTLSARRASPNNQPSASTGATDDRTRKHAPPKEPTTPLPEYRIRSNSEKQRNQSIETPPPAADAEKVRILSPHLGATPDPHDRKTRAASLGFSGMKRPKNK